jgi:hypothetical protein
MTHRMYHEKKAKRCIENLGLLKQKLERLEGVRIKKIEELHSEIDSIEKSYVTLRCEVCGQQFTVTFAQYVKGTYVRKCHMCKRKDNKEYIDKVEKLLTENGIKFSNFYCSPFGMIFELPHKDALY